MPAYEIIFFNGWIQWVSLPNGKYAVDPQYLRQFKKSGIGIEY